MITPKQVKLYSELCHTYETDISFREGQQKDMTEFKNSSEQMYSDIKGLIGSNNVLIACSQNIESLKVQNLNLNSVLKKFNVMIRRFRIFHLSALKMDKTGVDVAEKLASNHSFIMNKKNNPLLADVALKNLTREVYSYHDHILLLDKNYNEFYVEQLQLCHELSTVMNWPDPTIPLLKPGDDQKPN